MKRSAIFLLMCMVSVIFVGGGSEALASVTIVPIEESKLDELLGAKDNQLVVTFLAAWCGPCIDELPTLNKLYHRYKKKGLKLIGISIDFEGPGALQPIVGKLKINFPIYWYGEKGVKKFKLNAIPILFFIKNGEVVDKLYGKHPERSLNKRFKKFLK